MPRTHLETEHQELFYVDADLRRPLSVHIPSALGQLGYYVCLQLAPSWLPKLGDLRLHLEIGGLRPDDVTLLWGQDLDKAEASYPSRHGQLWAVMGRVRLSRGDGVLTFHHLPAGLERATVLLCTWPRFVASGQADEYLACQADPQWAPNGVPLGGIGTGKVEVSRDGAFRNFSGNNNQDMPFEEPEGLAGAAFHLTCDGHSRLLRSRAQGDVAGTPVSSADLRFPQVRLRFADVFPGLDAELHFTGPTVPHDLELASLPGFLCRVKLHNRSDHRRRLSLALNWPNLVGSGGGVGTPETNIGYADGSYRYFEAPDAPGQSPGRDDDLAWVRLTNEPNPEWAAADGRHYVALRGPGEGRDQGSGATVGDAFDLEPGAELVREFAVVWEMPHYLDQHGTDQGLYWQNHHADGLEILRRLFAAADDVFRRAGALAELLAASDLPAWARERLSNACYPLVTNSVFYRDGRFSINEGPTEMCGCYGTIDQRLGAYPATYLLFPELNATELALFAAVQSPTGGINHDLGHGHLENPAKEQTWPDIPCSFVLQTALHSWTTGDEAFARLNWPRAKQALLRHAAWAEAGNGVAQVGDGLGTSYDGYHYFGTTGYMATLWLAALAVARKWAVREEDTELLPRIDAWREAAVARLEADLWNGSYYRAYASPHGPTNDNAHAGMLAGTYYARMLAGEDLLPPERRHAAADALVRLNGSDRFAIPPDEVSAAGERMVDYGWMPYVECFCLAPLAILRHPALPGLWERSVRHLAQHGQRPCDTRLMYQPDHGEPSWGSYYMTAPASWLVYQARLDFQFETADGTLRLLPDRAGRFAVVHPCFWALAQCAGPLDHPSLQLTVREVFGDGALTVTAIEAPKGCGLQVDGRALTASAAATAYAAYDRFPLPHPVDLTPGATLAWQVLPSA